MCMVQVSVCLNVPMSACLETRRAHTLSYRLETRSFTELEARYSRQDLPVSSLPVEGFWGSHLVFYVGAVNSNPGPFPFTEKALTH